MKDSFFEHVNTLKPLLEDKIDLLKTNINIESFLSDNYIKLLSTLIESFINISTSFNSYFELLDCIKIFNDTLDKFKQIEELLNAQLIKGLQISSQYVTSKDIEHYLSDKMTSIKELIDKYSDCLEDNCIDNPFYTIIAIINDGLTYLSLYELKEDNYNILNIENNDPNEFLSNNINDDTFTIDSLKEFISYYLENHNEINYTYFIDSNDIGKTACNLSVFYSLRSSDSEEEIINISGQNYKIFLKYNIDNRPIDALLNIKKAKYIMPAMFIKKEVAA